MGIRRVVIDLDAGTDDALALLLFLHAEKLGLIKIEALICTSGNTSLQNVCRNVVRILETANRTDIPIYKGSYQPIVPPKFKLKFHGEDGFGDLQHPCEPNINIIQKEISATALHRIVAENPGEITLVCVGPLTNAAIPMIMFEDFARNIKEFYIMGGNYTGMGNVTSAAEFNFYTDPEAADIIFEYAQCPIYLLPWECCNDSDISFLWRTNNLSNIGGPVWRLIDRADKSVCDLNQEHDIWMSCDALLAFAYLYPDKIVKKKSAHVSIELTGLKTRGQVVLDHMNERKKQNTTIIEKVDKDFFKKLLIEVCNQN